jgi:hypothetical protein
MEIVMFNSQDMCKKSTAKGIIQISSLLKNEKGRRLFSFCPAWFGGYSDVSESLAYAASSLGIRIKL